MTTPPTSHGRTLAVTLGDPRGIGPEVAARAAGEFAPPDRPALLFIGPTGTGAECESGECVLARFLGLSMLTVCSPCNEDADCPQGEICELPEVDVVGALEKPGACGPR